MAEDAVKVFISYSHKDEPLRDSLATHLSNLQWQGIISSWYDHNNIGFRVVCSVFPALFYCQNWTMGIVRAYPEESRPVPATEITLSENKTGSDSLVSASRTVVRPISLKIRSKLKS